MSIFTNKASAFLHGTYKLVGPACLSHNLLREDKGLKACMSGFVCGFMCSI